jgi:hypothetical protein
LRAFALLSYPDIDLNPRCAEAEKLRGEGSRLILAATEDDTLVLDCLVPDAGAPTEDSWKPKVPVTLRAHLPDLSVTSDISRTLYCWLGTGKRVEVSVGRERGALVHHPPAGGGKRRDLMKKTGGSTRCMYSRFRCSSPSACWLRQAPPTG